MCLCSVPVRVDIRLTGVRVEHIRLTPPVLKALWFQLLERYGAFQTAVGLLSKYAQPAAHRRLPYIAEVIVFPSFDGKAPQLALIGRHGLKNTIL